MDLNKFDAININTDDINPLMEWKTNNNIYVRQFKNILHEGVINVILSKSDMTASFQTMSSMYFKIINDQCIYFDYYVKCATQTNIIIKNYKQLDLTVGFKDNGDYVINDIHLIDDNLIKKGLNNKATIEDIIMDIVTLYCTLMAYMTYFEPEFIIKDEVIPYKEKRLKKLQRAARYNPNHTIKFNKVIYTLRSNTHYKNITKKMYNRIMECWSVKGHWRQLKDRRIWIEPYDKGTGSKQAKTYDLTDSI